MSKRDQWTIGKAYHMTAGELMDGVELIGCNGKPFKRGVGVVVVTRKHYNEICRMAKAIRKGKA